jgi:hypothetical protein
MNIELTKERSQQLADTLEAIKIMLWGIDIEYAKAVSAAMRQDASRQDSLAVLNPRYNPDKSKLICLQSSMLDNIIEYVEKGKQVDALKTEINLSEAAFDKIAAMFF